ncbi:MotA/TolQ/ExbB proton channel family protein [Halosquirtibacter laminarini]|uniref:MotA/TolQ/ExbB proton channel family protein n=1 Tax=Halosquirtibacter laminarini TaxID=3374600 RepID=A0AC61NFY5_9BACT|nr:MotA/TolQ/ExbB proton channel family protein [Prolixibacteraceae bacterium]
MMNEITNLLYWISTGLLIPVTILLLIFFIRSIFMIGAFYGTYINKMKFYKSHHKEISLFNKDNIRQEISSIDKNSKLLLPIYIQKLTLVEPMPLYYNKVLDDFENECQKDLSKSQIIAKIGPILGLMGTLIPMGPALVGLAAGDIESMALNMQIAFATTVIGLLTGALGFIIMQIKKRWYASDISYLEFVIELLKQSQP